MFLIVCYIISLSLDCELKIVLVMSKHSRVVEEWIPEPDSIGSNSHSATYQLCDLGQLN